MIAQIAGAIVAAFTYALIYSGHTFALGPQPGYKWGQVVAAELVCTFSRPVCINTGQGEDYPQQTKKPLNNEFYAHVSREWHIECASFDSQRLS